MKYRDGPVIRKCARGEANKVVAAAAQAARAATPPPPFFFFFLLMGFLWQRMRLFLLHE